MADLRFFVTQEGTLNQGGSGNDSIFNYTGTFSSDTVKGSGGNDLISFANQTTARRVVAGVASATAGSADIVTASFSGTWVSAGNVEKGSGVFTTAVTAGGGEVSATIQSLDYTGLTTLRGGIIGGGTGNDSIYLGDQITELASAYVGGGKGDDLLGTFNSGANTAGKLNTVFSGSSIAGGEGNDTVFVNLSAASGTLFKVAGNGGDDSVMLSGEVSELNSGLVGGGKGNDSVILDARTGIQMSVRGGNGNDSIWMDLSAAAKNVLIEGDGNLTGADTMRLSLGKTYSANTILGGEGDDSVVLSGLGTDGGGNLIDGGGGADTIFIQSAGDSDLSGSSVKGGAGNDSILLQMASAGVAQSSMFYGGAGDDTITLESSKAEGSAGSYGTTIEGGAGADSLTNSGIAADAGSGTFSYTTYSESTLDSMDTITFSTAAVSAGGATFDSSRVRVNISTGSLSLATGVGDSANGGVSAKSGYIVFSGYSDNSLTARVSAIDAGFTTTGVAAVFTTDNTTRYLFVQGGTTDLVARLSDEDQLSAGKASIFKSGNTIGFGDEDA